MPSARPYSIHMDATPAALLPLLALAAALLRYADTLDRVVDVRAATAYRYGTLRDAVHALETLVEVGEAANPVTARCMVRAAQHRLDKVGREIGLLRSA